MRDKNKLPPKVVMLPKSLLIAWLISYVVILILVIGSFQYANFVDRRSNQHWCGIVKTLTSSYEKEPPDTEIGKLLRSEFNILQKDWCT